MIWIWMDEAYENPPYTAVWGGRELTLRDPAAMYCSFYKTEVRKK